MILVFITFLSCSEKTIRKDECLVICEIKNAVGKKYYIKELDIKDINTIDSALIREEAKPIIFKIDVPVPGLYAITDAGDGYIPIVLKNGEQIKISADGDNLQTGFQLEGSEESEVLYAYFQFNNRNLDKIQKLNTLLLTSQHRLDFSRVRDSVYVEYEIIFANQQQSVLDLVDRYPGSLAILYIINQRFGRMLPVTEADHFPYFQKIDSALMVNYPDNKHTIDHHSRVNRYAKQKKEMELGTELTKIGKIAPNITLPDPTENEHSLISLKGKVVLLYFWSSWNSLSRQMNLDLLTIYDKYHKKGFEIFAVSLDNNAEMWEDAIKIDQIKWLQVSDLKYPGSPVQKLYALEEIPTIFLLDKEGKILIKNPGLDQIINELNKLLN